MSSRWGGEPKYKKCKQCGHSHPIWLCDVFRGRSLEKKWEKAKRLGLCYRCLGNNHLGNSCPEYRECKIDGCKDNHHRLLHAEKVSRQGETKSGSSNGISPLPQVAGNGIERAIQEIRESTSSANQTHLSQESVTSHITEGGANTHTFTAQTGEKVVALQTESLILKNGNVRFLVNCFLDEGSEATYINEDLVEELVVRGGKEPVIVNVANDQWTKFMSMSFQVGFESIDGEMNRIISAKISQKICERMKPINWLKIKQLVPSEGHTFPTASPKTTD